MTAGPILAAVNPGALVFLAIVAAGVLRGLATRKRKAGSQRSRPAGGTTGTEPQKGEGSAAAPVRHTASERGQVVPTKPSFQSRPRPAPKPSSSRRGAKTSRQRYRKPTVQDLLRGRWED